MKKNLLSKGILVSLGLLTLAACNGGSGGAVSGGSGVSQGPVTGFGSVYVNGVKFNTDATAFAVDGSAGTGATGQSNLKLGMVATVAWTKDSNGKYTARSVKYSDDVQGVVSEIIVSATDPKVGTLKVLGQLVHVSALTIFEGNGTTSVTGLASLASLTGDQFVEVSGLKSAAGEIYATRIELKSDSEYEMKGIVSESSGTTFKVGTLAVTFSPAPANGACVEVEGITLTGGVLTATKVKVDDSCTLGGGLRSDSTDEVELEGYVSVFTNVSTDFKVNGQLVRVNSATLYEGTSSTSAILADGARVEVEGQMSNGVLVAKKVSLDPEMSDREESAIEMEVPRGGAVAISGVGTTTTMKVFDSITVTVSDATRFEDGILRDLSNIANNSLKIKAYSDGAKVIATRISKTDNSSPSLQGPVSSTLGTSSLVILGVTVNTSVTTKYQDDHDASITTSAFFAKAAAGAVVKAKASAISGSVMVATELEIED